IGSEGSTVTLARQWGFSSTLQSTQNDVEPIRYQPVVAGVSDRSGSGLQIRDLTLENGLLATESEDLHYNHTSDSGAPAGEVRRSINADLVRVVTDHLQQGVAPEQIAVLARTNGVAKELLSSLRQGGIKAVQTRTEAVFTSRAAEELRVLLWVLAEPTNPRRTGMLVFTWFRFHEADQIPGFAQALETFGPGSLSRRLLDRSTIQCVLSDGFPERSWTDLDHLLDLLGEAFPAGVAPTLALSWLEEQMSLPEVDEAGADAAARRVESDGGSVVVTTIHAAKGLEFDVVLIPEIEPSPKGKDKATQRGLVALPDGRLVDFGRLSAKSVGDQSELSLDEERQRTDETARLIYVALTRAKKSLVVWISDLNHHGYPNVKDAERQRISKTSLWRLLVESSRVASGDSVEAAQRRCEHVDAPFVASLEVVRVDDAARVSSSRLPTTSSVDVDLEDILDPPAIDELLRRWSYTEIHLGEAGDRPTGSADVSDGDTSNAMAGALAEDTYGDG
ncbi:MAG: 3'-5' exonuclease, partial [Actinomycetota bacterium]